MGTNKQSWVAGLCLLAVGCGSGGGDPGDSSSPSDDKSQEPASLLTDTLAVTSHTPADGAVQVDPGAVVTVTFETPIAQECVQEPDTWLQSADGVTVAGGFSFSGGGRSLRFTPDAPLSVETDYVFQLSALTCDLDGKLLEEEYSFSFRTLDETPPTILGATIADGATDVARDVTVGITFSEAIGASSVTGSTVYLSDVFGSRFPIQAHVDGSTLTVDPLADLPGDRSMVLVVTRAVSDRAGNSRESSWSTGFRTAPDSVAPRLVSAWPDLRVGMSPVLEPIVQFDEAVDVFSVESASVSFVDEYLNIVPYAVETTPDRKTLRLVPKVSLVPGRSYAVIVESGPGALTDLSGNPLANSGAASFEVGTDASVPTVVSSFPEDGAVRVSPNVFPKIVFDDNLEADRVGAATVELLGPSGVVPATVVLRNGSTVQLEPLENLTPSTRYQIRVRGGPEGLRDVAGNYLRSDLTRTFKVSDDPVLPVLRITPVAGSNIVSPDSIPSIVADAPLDPGSVGASTIYLQDDVGGTVAGTIVLERADRVVHFEPDAPLVPGTAYRLTVLGGPTGVRKASGNWLDATMVQSFTVTQTVDTLPPAIEVSINDAVWPRSTGRTVPPFGFEIDVYLLDPETFAHDLGTIELVLTGSQHTLTTELVFASARITDTRLTYRVPSEHALPEGAYVLSARGRDLSGNLGIADEVTFDVAGATAELLPFERTQVVWVRFDLDRDGNGRADFEDDLVRLGLMTEGDPTGGTNAVMAAIVRDGILSRAHQLYSRKPNGGRRGEDSVPIRFSHRRPLGVPSMQIACGGFDPEGEPNRTFGDDTSGTLGRAFYDYRNERLNDNNTSVDPGVGVFPSELYLYESDVHLSVYPTFLTTFAADFLPLAPAMGGTSFGSQTEDSVIASPEFDYSTATPSERARYETVFEAADAWATAIGTILAHECGHSLGLVAPGRSSADLHGDASLHNEFANLTDVMGSAVGYSGLVSVEYRFRDLNIAYLRHRMLLR